MIHSKTGSLILAIIAAVTLVIPGLTSHDIHPFASTNNGADASSANSDSLLPSPLEVLEIKLYNYTANATELHVGQPALSSVPAGSLIAVNSLTRNHEYSGEHFDYITEVFDSEGIVVYLDVRYGMAVPIASQIGIDSGTPMVLDEPGKYTVKVFTWSNLDEGPIPLSSGASRIVDSLAQNSTANQAPVVPNIIVIMSDDLDKRSLDILLQEGMMPNLKRYLVDEGVTFTESFATYPLCCPSRATFLTGQYPHNHNVWNNNLPLGGVTKLDDSSTIATWLQDSGYHTAYVGKYLNRYGQDTAETYIPPGWNDWQATVGSSAYRMYSYTVNDNGALVKYGTAASDYQTDVLADRSVDVISEAESIDSTPFFLYINPLAPHNDGTIPDCSLNYGSVGSTLPPERYTGVTADIDFPQPPSFNEAEVGDKPRALQHPLLDSTQIGCLEDLFHARLDTMLAVDDLVGDVVTTLANNAELADTMIVFTSDNGFMLGEHRLHGKQYVYEESIRLPLYMRIPQVTPKTIDRLVINNDLAPTFLEYAKAAADIPVDGRSLVPLIEDPNTSWRNGFLIEDNLYSAIRTENYVYAQNHNSGTMEIYDLNSDPYQLLNVAGTSSWEPKIAVLEEWQMDLAGCRGTSCESIENQRAP